VTERVRKLHRTTHYETCVDVKIVFYTSLLTKVLSLYVTKNLTHDHVEDCEFDT